MAITPRLSRGLQQALGDEAGADMVNWMQQVDAQRAELRELNELNFSRFDARLSESRAATQADLAELRAATQADLAELRAATQADLAELRQELHTGFAELRQEMARLEGRFEAHLERRIGDLMKWSFVFWVGAVGAIAALAGVLR